MKYKGLVLLNLSGFTFYSALAIVMRAPELVVCAGIWFAAFVFSFKAYSNSKFCRGGKKT